jgi:hypothetical protein
MIIFYKQKKCIKTEDNFQRRKESTTKTFETTKVYQRRPQQSTKSNHILNKIPTKHLFATLNDSNPNNMATTLITQL